MRMAFGVTCGTVCMHGVNICICRHFAGFVVVWPTKTQSNFWHCMHTSRNVHLCGDVLCVQATLFLRIERCSGCTCERTTHSLVDIVLHQGHALFSEDVEVGCVDISVVPSEVVPALHACFWGRSCKRRVQRDGR